jgi:hypothetical protein
MYIKRKRSNTAEMKFKRHKTGNNLLHHRINKYISYHPDDESS